MGTKHRSKHLSDLQSDSVCIFLDVCRWILDPIPNRVKLNIAKEYLATLSSAGHGTIAQEFDRKRNVFATGNKDGLSGLLGCWRSNPDEAFQENSNVSYVDTSSWVVRISSGPWRRIIRTEKKKA